MELDDIEKALEYYDRAIALFTKEDHVRGLAEALLRKARVLGATDRYSEAEPLLCRSRDLAEKANQWAIAASARVRLGILRARLGKDPYTDLLEGMEILEKVGIWTEELVNARLVTDFAGRLTNFDDLRPMRSEYSLLRRA